jgi:hypothetical protein
MKSVVWFVMDCHQSYRVVDDFDRWCVRHLKAECHMEVLEFLSSLVLFFQLCFLSFVDKSCFPLVLLLEFLLLLIFGVSDAISCELPFHVLKGSCIAVCVG